jgi:hypothetical protein
MFVYLSRENEMKLKPPSRRCREAVLGGENGLVRPFAREDRSADVALIPRSPRKRLLTSAAKHSITVETAKEIV